MRDNRIIDFIEILEKKNLRTWDEICKELRNEFNFNFRLNEVECRYLTKYYKGELNYNVAIFDLNGNKL